MDAQRFIPGDASLVEKIVNYLKAKGIFDEFRHECLADVDTKSSCQNLSQRVDGYASKFLANETWNPDLNKNELRNKLRKNIDESGMLAVGADHVVEQVINPKFYQFFLKIQETVHQYLREQTEAACKKFENVTNENSSAASDSLEASTSKSKAVSSDPIAEILSFTHPKPKPVSTSSSHKGEASQFKHLDSVKKKDESLKKREEKTIVKEEKASTLTDASSEASTEAPVELKSPNEKIKKEGKSEESEISVDTVKKVAKEEIKSEESNSVSDSTAAEDKNSKAVIKMKDEKSAYKDDKIKHKSKNFKTSNPSTDPKKHKKDCSKDLDKHAKLKVKSSKESHSSSFAKSDRSGEAKLDHKDASKIKLGESSATKGFDSRKVLQKHSSKKEKDGSSKTKGNVEKSEKMKAMDEKTEKFVYEGSDASKGSKGSSQESDAEKRSSTSVKKDKSKTHHHKKEHSSNKLYKYGKMPNKIAVAKDAEDADSRIKTEKGSKLDKTKESIIEAAKISSRSNSHGSSSSVGSSSNTSKDNLSQTSDEAGVDSEKLKKKKTKERTTCQTSKEELPPPPPPPPSSSMELQSSEMSHEESAMSSSNFESSDENDSEKVVSESEIDSSLANTSSDFCKSVSSSRLNSVSDIFMYSSSSEFEGFGTSPDKARIRESEISVSSVHTSDLSSFEDEFSDDESSDNEQVGSKRRKKRLTLKEAEKFIKNKASAKNFEFDSEGRKQKGSLRAARDLTYEDNSQEIDFDSSAADEPKRSLRRERKLNPKYASSEYTSIFNAKKDTFITKQTSPCPSPNKPESSEKNSEQNASFYAETSDDDNVLSSDRAFDTSSSDEIESLRYVDKPKKTKRKALGRNKSISSSIKRKLDDSFDNVSRKRPCSRSSVDSFNSEFATNENKPFNCDTKSMFQEKKLRSGKDFEISLGKNSLLRKQRGPKNGDLLQKTFKNLKAKAEKD